MNAFIAAIYWAAACIIVVSGSVMLGECLLALWLSGTLRKLHPRRLLSAVEHAVRRRLDCARDYHRDTIAVSYGGVPALAQRCVDCGRTEFVGYAFFGATNHAKKRTT